MTPTTALNPLRTYLDEKGISLVDCAAALDEPYHNVRRYSLPFDHKEFAMPRRPVMEKLFAWSGGEVQPNQFYGVPPTSEIAISDTAGA